MDLLSTCMVPVSCTGSTTARYRLKCGLSHPFFTGRRGELVIVLLRQGLPETVMVYPMKKAHGTHLLKELEFP